MLLLSTDTSGRQGSIALARAGDATQSDGVEVIEVVALDGGAFSAQLVPQIADLLARHGFGKQEIDGFIVASGPGSFTGLRVGLAAIKALAEISRKPIVAMSLLEALAIISGLQGSVRAVLDAGREEVYCGEYEVTVDAAKLVREELLNKEEFLVKARNAKMVTSNDKLADAARAAGLAVTPVRMIDAGTIACLGWRKLQTDDTVSPEQLEANYIRRTDAEILAKPSAGR
jgi:tRNA threonylcarbamoyladenosine biosynthesis protein TsaB